MTTQHDYDENDVETTVVEQTPALETRVASATFATTTSAGEETDEAEAQAISTPADVAPPTETYEEGHTEEPARAGAEITAAPAGEQQDQEKEKEKENEKTSQGFEAAPFVETQEEVRPFTAFIEEFREAEARFSAALQESREEAFKLLSPVEGDLAAPAEPSPALDTLVSPEGASGEEAPAALLTPVPEAPATGEVSVPAPAAERPPVISEQEQAEETSKDTAVEAKTEKAEPAARAVSPLLRPPSRVRVPRHSSRHQREETAPPVEAPPPEATATSEAAPAPAETPAEPETPRPARRYRFDRPAATAASTQPAPSRAEAEQVTSAQTKSASSGTQSAARQAVAQEQVPEQSAGAAPQAAPEAGRRRSGSERQKEQAAATASAIDAAASATEATEAPGNIAPEDLPPLEYSELQKVTSRRRRRHRSSSSNGAAATTPAATPTPLVMPVPPAPAAPTNSTNGTTASTPYTIVSGYTVNQMNQGNETTGPFMAPEPSPARGSVFTGRVIGRAEPQRPQTPPHTVTRHTEGGPSAASMNYFANIVAQAIQTQTDRMVAELRRASQAPASVSVSLPPFPSTERVGVFVDVANLLYSARTLRIAIDFGKLLDFLRGNRRLVRAHAYCPTSPQPGDEQMFLQAVKGLGYRITTKNYKTFSSGAKKADLDLDLCMDVVRLVDGRAVDCIVLVSGDSDFMPMLDYCSDHGVRVEVAAFDEAMSATLRQSCDLFINLSMLEEIRA